MEALQTVLLVVQVFVAVTLIGFILVQHGKGADAGAAFGSGASSTVFGSRGSGNFLTRATTTLATVFLLNSLALGYLATKREAPMSVMDRVVEQQSRAATGTEKNLAGISQESEGQEKDDIPTAPASDIDGLAVPAVDSLPEEEAPK